MWYLARLLKAERQRRGTRARSRVLGCLTQAVLVLRWLLNGTRMSQLVRDNKISKSTGYDYLHEGINVLAAQAPACTARCWQPNRPATATSASTAP